LGNINNILTNKKKEGEKMPLKLIKPVTREYSRHNYFSQPSKSKAKYTDFNELPIMQDT